MTNFMAECLHDAQKAQKEKKITRRDVQEFFCVRCRNQDCNLAGQGQTPWLYRMMTQEDRIFNANVSGENDPHYRDVKRLMFEDMKQHAMRLVVSAQRGDWEIPDTGESTSTIVNRAVSNLKHFEEVEDAPDENIDDLYEEDPVEEPPKPPSLKKPSLPDNVVQPPGRVNTPNRSGLMIGGGPVPKQHTQIKQDDPWAHPDQKERIVPVGGTVTLGGKKK